MVYHKLRHPDRFGYIHQRQGKLMQGVASDARLDTGAITKKR